MSQDLLKLSPELVSDQLDAILESSHFDASTRNRSFLEFVVNAALKGRSGTIDGKTIAQQIMGRGADFDPSKDAIVRVEAGRLRKSLERYYLVAGNTDTIKISIPLGGYVPVFAKLDSSLGIQSTTNVNKGMTGAQALRDAPTIFVSTFLQEESLEEHPHLARSFTRQLIVGLTRFCDLEVIGAETSLRYSRAEDPDTYLKTLGVGSILSGFVTLSERRLCIEALLTDAETDRLLWAETYNRDLLPSELLNLRDEVADAVVQTLAQPYGIIFSKARDLDGPHPATFTSYDHVVQFYQYWQAYDFTLFQPVRLGLENVIATDPSYSEAFACLSQMYSNAHRFGYDVSATTEDPLARAAELAQRSIELAPRSGRGFHALALAYWFRGEIEGSLEAFETGLKLNPNDTNILADLGHHYALLARWDKAVPMIEQSYSRNPAQPSTYRVGLSLFHYAHGRFEEALTEAQKIDAPHVVYGELMIAASAGQLGMANKAKDALSRILNIDPDYGVHLKTDLKARHVNLDVIEMIAIGLSKAGLACS